MIKIDKDKFEKFVLAGTNSTAVVFESLEDSFSISTQKLQRTVFGSMDINNLSDVLTLDAERFICMDAFYCTIPQLDLVLTATGFGVVNNQNVSPASRDRVEALRNLVRQCADDALDRIITTLVGNKDWTDSANARLMVDSLFYTADQLRDYAGKPDAHRTDLYALRPTISEAEELIYRTISAEFFTYLISQLRKNSLSDHETLLVWTLRKAVGFFINKQVPAFKKELANVSNLLENDIDKFPVYRNSEAYKVKHFEYYKNEKDDSCYFFG